MNILGPTETYTPVAIFLWIELLFHRELIKSKPPRLGTLIWEPQTKQLFVVIIILVHQDLGQQTLFQKQIAFSDSTT